MKGVLIEQLPPGLFQLIEDLKKEIQDLRRVIEESGIMPVSDAEFLALQDRVTQAETTLGTIQTTLNGVTVDIETLKNLTTTVESLSAEVQSLSSYDTNNSTMVTALQNRLTTIETNHVNLATRDLTIPTNVSSSFILPVTDDYMSEISWASSHPEYITTDGTVTQPTATIGDVIVTLTATINYGQATSTKVFNVTVVAAPITDAERLDIAASKLDSSIFVGSETEGIIYVSENQALPTEIDSIPITWASSNEGVFANDGTVIRPVDADAPVLLTATLTSGTETRTVQFNIVVLMAEVVLTDDQKVQEDLAMLSVPSNTSTNLTLDTVGDVHSSTITWASSNELIIATDGTVTQPDAATGDTAVTLTATVTYGTATATKEFIVTVTALTA